MNSETGPSDAEPSFQSVLKSFVLDLTAMFAAKFRVDKGLLEHLAPRYAKSLSWIGKACGSLWLLGITCWLFINLFRNTPTILVGFLATLCFGSAVLALRGWKQSQSWLKLAGWCAIVSLALQIIFVLMGQGRMALSFNFISLVGTPLVVFLVALIPAGDALNVLRDSLPEAYAAIARAAKLAFLGVIWVGLFAVGLQFFPAGTHPLAPLVLAPISMLFIVLIGLRLIRFDPDRYLGWPTFAAGLLLSLGLTVAMTLPAGVARFSRNLGDIDLGFLNPPQLVVFHSSSEIDFLDLKGRPRVWYASRKGGGLDTYYNESEVDKTPDARFLQLADTEGEQQSIRDWVDAEAARQRDEQEKERRAEAQRNAKPPVPVTFESAKEIRFVNIQGAPVLWYALRTGGGFDLFYNDSALLQLEDARLLQLVDSEDERTSIGKWVDEEALRRKDAIAKAKHLEDEAQAAKVAAEQKAKQLDAEKEAARVAEQKRIADEIAQNDAQRKEAERLAAVQQEANRVRLAEESRRASYVGTLPKSRFDYVVLVANPPTGRLTEATSALVDELAKQKLNATGSLFADAFVCAQGFEAFFNGQGGTDIAAMSLTKVAPHLLLVRAGPATTGLTKGVNGAHTYTRTFTAAVIDASDGAKITDLVVADVTGAGITESAAQSRFFERATEVLVEKLKSTQARLTTD